MEYYNKNKLIKLSLNKKKPSKIYQYEKEVKVFGFVIKKEGVYTLYDIPLDNMPLNHYLENGIIYEKPSVILYFEDFYEKVYYFDLYSNALIFKNDITDNINWMA